MSKKSPKIAALIASCRDRASAAGWDPHYLGYFECFNQALFYEAHDVLEELWLEDRHGPNGNFYKGLIQFAGAFVHLQKHCSKYPRLRPSVALFDLARGNLGRYSPRHEGLDVAWVVGLAREWRQAVIAGGYELNPLNTLIPPLLELESRPAPAGKP